MERAIPTIWNASELYPGLPTFVETAAPERVAPRRMRKFFAARADVLAASDSSGLPPLVQFVMRGIAGCRTRLKSNAADAASLRLIGRLTLGGKKSLSLVEADGVRFLIGGSLDSVTVIVPVGGVANAQPAQSVLQP